MVSEQRNGSLKDAAETINRFQGLSDNTRLVAQHAERAGINAGIAVGMLNQDPSGHTRMNAIKAAASAATSAFEAKALARHAQSMGRGILEWSSAALPSLQPFETKMGDNLLQASSEAQRAGESAEFFSKMATEALDRFEASEASLGDSAVLGLSLPQVRLVRLLL